MMDSRKKEQNIIDKKGEDKQGPSGLPKSSHLQDSIQSHLEDLKIRNLYISPYAGNCSPL